MFQRRGFPEADLPSAASMQASTAAQLVAEHPSAGASAITAASSAQQQQQQQQQQTLPGRMLDLMSDTVDQYHQDGQPSRLALRFAHQAAAVPERNVWVLWHRMLEDLELSAALSQPDAVGLDRVPLARRWHVAPATFVQHVLAKCPRLRRMAIAVKWLEDTFEVPAIANSVTPFTPQGKFPVDPDLQRKLFLQLRGGRWQQASVLADEGSAHVAHMLTAAQMLAPTPASTASDWAGKMPRAPLFGEYEAQCQSSASPLLQGRTRNPHRLPLMLRMLEHVLQKTTAAGAATSSSSSEGEDAAAAATPAIINDAQNGSFDFFDGIAAIICGDERAMRDACRVHFGAAASGPSHLQSAATSTARGTTPVSSWQDEVWALLRSHLVAVFTVAILRGACDAASPGSSLAEQFDGIFSKEALDRFVSTMESRCGLGGGSDFVSADDAASADWFATMESNIGNIVIARLHSLGVHLPKDSADGIALQSLTMFLSDMSRGAVASHVLPGITAAVSPLRDGDGVGVGGNGGNSNTKSQRYYLHWFLPEQASLACLASFAHQKQLLQHSPQDFPIFGDIVAAMIRECMCDPALDVRHLVARLEAVARYSALVLDPHRRVQTHTALFRCMRMRFVGDVGRFIGLETDSAEALAAKFLRQADEQRHGNSVAVDNALKTIASRLKDDPAVPRLTHDVRCEAILWKSLLSQQFRPTTIAEAVAALKDLWAQGRKLTAMKEICEICARKLNADGDMISDDSSLVPGSSAGSLGSPNSSPRRSASSPNAGAVMASAREQIDFWTAVIASHEIAAAISGILEPLSGSSSSSISSSSGGNSMPMLESRRHDVVVEAQRLIQALSMQVDRAAELCPKYGGSAVAAAIELLSEAVRTMLPHVGVSALQPLFQSVFAKLPMLDACQVFGIGPTAPGVDLLSQENAASLMGALQALRLALVTQIQRRRAEAARAGSLAMLK